MRATKISRPAVFVYAVAIIAMAGTTVHAADTPDAMVTVHHVKLNGTGIGQALLADLNTNLKNCGAVMNLAPDRVPDGDKIIDITDDVYYGAGFTTTYKTMLVYKMSPLNCKLSRDKTTTITVRSASGTCTLDSRTMRAIGKCATAPAQMLQAASAGPASAGMPAQPTGDAETIAGQKCAVYQGEFMGMRKRWCVAQAGSFIPRRDPTSPVAGLLLKDEGWMNGRENQLLIDMVATEVHTDMRIPLKVAAPQFSGDYKIVGPGAAK